MKKIHLLATLFYFVAYSQESKNPFSYSGYIETYYSYDIGNPDNHLRPSYAYSHNKHNELNLNLGFVKVSYAKDNLRGNLALMAGTYPEYNLASEEDGLKNIFEANVGVKISSKNNLWIDAGIMPSHIGFESAIGKDCVNLTRSLLADNSPYYETGVKLGYTSPSEKWYLALMYLNGWQRIKKIDGNQTPAFGTQITYKPNIKTTYNFSTYIGNEQPDIVRKFRYFNNLYAQYKLNDKTSFTAGFDLGFQESELDDKNFDCWFSPILIAQYKPTSKIQLGFRGEYYQDKNEVIVNTGTDKGFDVFGGSINFDYLISENAMFRIEARSLSSRDKIFQHYEKPVNYNTFFTTSIALSF